MLTSRIQLFHAYLRHVPLRRHAVLRRDGHARQRGRGGGAGRPAARLRQARGLALPRGHRAAQHARDARCMWPLHAVAVSAIEVGGGRGVICEIEMVAGKGVGGAGGGGGGEGGGDGGG